MANKASKLLEQIAEETGAELQECDRCGKKMYVLTDASNGESICESCDKKERKQERREHPFTVGQYMLLIREPDRANVFGTITRKHGRHQHVIVTAQGFELTGDDEDLCEASPGDISWNTYCIPKGSCLVNLEPEDSFYTSDPHLGINFSPNDEDTGTLNHVLREALNERFHGVEFLITPIMDNGDKRHTLHNNSSIGDDEINVFVSAFLDKASEFPEIWNTDEDDEDDEEPDE